MQKKNRTTEQHDLHRTSYSFQERLVGLFVLAAPLVLIALFWINSDTRHLFEDRVTYYVLMANALDVTRETSVRISGIEVGAVDAIDVTPDNQIRLTLKIRQRFAGMVRSDSVASLSSLSLLGKTAINITPGDNARDRLEEGAFLEAKEVESLDSLMDEVVPTLAQLRSTIAAVGTLVESVEPRQITAIAEDMHVAVANLRQLSDRLLNTELAYLDNLLLNVSRDLGLVTEQIASGRGSIGRLLFDEQMAADLAAALNRSSQALGSANQVLDSLHPLVNDAGAMTANLRGLAAGLPETGTEIRRLAVQLNGLASTLSVELQEFPKLLTQMKMLMEETDRLLDGMKRLWPLSGAVPRGQDNLLINPMPSNE